MSNPILKERQTLNPYRHAAWLILRRLAWDINPQSFVSRARLKAIRNRYRGQRAVILCNGPSLANVDFALLRDVFTIGLNKINLLFSKTEFRPSCIVSVNPYVIEQNADFFRDTRIPLYLDSTSYGVLRSAPHITYLHSSYVGFARDVAVSIYQSCTVTYVALQLAFHMGFQSVALVGCDHSFSNVGSPNAVGVATGVDKNHFDPSYFSGDQKWQYPDLMESEIGYMKALRMYREFGRELVNATDGGNLEVFPRRALREFVR